jgi:hypothetical protein
MTIRIKKIGSVIETEIMGVRIYGEIIDNTKRENDMPIYDVKLDNGDIKQYGHYSIKSVTTATQSYQESTRKSISDNPLKGIGDWISLPLEKWERIINALPDELKKDFSYISGKIKTTKDLYKLN